MGQNFSRLLQSHLLTPYLGDPGRLISFAVSCHVCKLRTIIVMLGLDLKQSCWKKSGQNILLRTSGLQDMDPPSHGTARHTSWAQKAFFQRNQHTVLVFHTELTRPQENAPAGGWRRLCREGSSYRACGWWMRRNTSGWERFSSLLSFLLSVVPGHLYISLDSGPLLLWCPAQPLACATSRDAYHRARHMVWPVMPQHITVETLPA